MSGDYILVWDFGIDGATFVNCTIAAAEKQVIEGYTDNTRAYQNEYPRVYCNKCFTRYRSSVRLRDGRRVVDRCPKCDNDTDVIIEERHGE